MDSSRQVDQGSASAVPGALVPLIGREQAIEAVVALLSEDEARVVTLLGPGGVGKTRLAIEVAGELERVHGADVRFIPLAHVTDPESITVEVARALGVRDEVGAALDQSLMAALQGENIVLVLDNLEQIPLAGGTVAGMLRACPGLTILATSRSPLRVTGERRFTVDPLKGEAAARLFLNRGRDAGAAALDPADVTIAAICERLDGLPLALELAAARLRVLSPAALLARLTHQLTLLAGGNLDLPLRQRTMEATIAWSHDLLPPSQQRALRRLSVIPGSFALVTAAAALETDDADAMETLEAFVDQSLLQVAPSEAGEPSFVLLQTVRDFLLDLPDPEHARSHAQSALAASFVRGADGLRMGLSGPDSRAWQARCRHDRALALAAIEWLVEQGDAAGAVAVAGARWRHWYLAGAYSEGQAALKSALGVPGDVPPASKANALNGLGALSAALGHEQVATEAYGAAIAEWEQTGDLRGLASTHNNQALLALDTGAFDDAEAGLLRAIELLAILGDHSRLAATEDNLGLLYSTLGRTEAAAELHARSLATSRLHGKEEDIATSSHHLGSALLEMGRLDEAEAMVEESRATSERVGDRDQAAYALNTLGNIAVQRGDHAAARNRYHDALAIWREHGSSRGISLASFNLGVQAIEGGDLRTAAALLRESLTLRRGFGNQRDFAFSLEGFAGLALACGQAELAARIAAAAHALREQSGVGEKETDPRPELRRELGKARFGAAWRAGLAMSPDQAIAETELVVVPASHDRGREAVRPAVVLQVERAAPVDHGLTERELEVLRLVAEGRTNAGIGEALYISPFTAKTHVANLLGKIGVESRAAASTWAAQRGLL